MRVPEDGGVDLVLLDLLMPKKDGLEVLVPQGFNVTRDASGSIYAYPQGDTSVPASGVMPKGGYYFDAILRQPDGNRQTQTPAGARHHDMLSGEIHAALTPICSLRSICERVMARIRLRSLKKISDSRSAASACLRAVMSRSTPRKPSSSPRGSRMGTAVLSRWR
jgi:hypothetical protein